MKKPISRCTVPLMRRQSWAEWRASGAGYSAWDPSTSSWSSPSGSSTQRRGRRRGAADWKVHNEIPPKGWVILWKKLPQKRLFWCSTRSLYFHCVGWGDMEWDLLRLGRRRVRLCVVWDDTEWDFASFGTLRRLGRRKVRLCVIWDDTKWDFASFGTTQSEILGPLGLCVIWDDTESDDVEWEFVSTRTTGSPTMRRPSRAQHIAYFLPVFLNRLDECKLSLFTINN